MTPSDLLLVSFPSQASVQGFYYLCPRVKYTCELQVYWGQHMRFSDQELWPNIPLAYNEQHINIYQVFLSTLLKLNINNNPPDLGAKNIDSLCACDSLLQREIETRISEILPWLNLSSTLLWLCSNIISDT